MLRKPWSSQQPFPKIVVINGTTWWAISFSWVLSWVVCDSCFVALRVMSVVSCRIVPWSFVFVVWPIVVAAVVKVLANSAIRTNEGVMHNAPRAVPMGIKPVIDKPRKTILRTNGLRSARGTFTT